MPSLHDGDSAASATKQCPYSGMVWEIKMALEQARMRFPAMQN